MLSVWTSSFGDKSGDTQAFLGYLMCLSGSQETRLAHGSLLWCHSRDKDMSLNCAQSIFQEAQDHALEIVVHGGQPIHSSV